MEKIDKNEYVKDENLNDWINSLYDGDDAYFDYEYKGMKLKFKAKYPSKVALTIERMKEDERGFKLLSILSVSPKLTVEHLKKMPTDLIQGINRKLFSLTSKTDELKKKA